MNKATELSALSKNQMISILTKSPHGKLEEYLPVGMKAAHTEGEFFAHLIAWDRHKGQIRDSKVALPVVSLATTAFNNDYVENSLAHLALLNPRDLVRALRFAWQVKTPGRTRAIRRTVTLYLRDLESNWSKWQRVAVQHRTSLKSLYSDSHFGRVKPSTMADMILFHGNRPNGSVFEAIHNLSKMSPLEAAGSIMDFRIPFLIAMGALGANAKHPDLVLALINRMSPNELVNNTKMLERLGIKTNPVLRAAYAEAIGRAGRGTTNTFKATKAAEALGDDSILSEKLKGLQEKQLNAQKGIEGDWLVLGDKSGSMQHAIEGARQVAATLARMVKGKVHLIFFDTSPRGIDVTGKSYDEILELTKGITAGGGTSMGCALLWAAERKLAVDGIAIVSDGGENQPPVFAQVYQVMGEIIGKNVPVYLYHMAGEQDTFSRNCSMVGLDVQKFDLTSGDYYALPNLIQTMRSNRYSLTDEILDTKLLKLGDVLKSTKEAVNA